MKKLYAAIAASMLLITPVYAQESCGSLEAAEQLVAKYKEIPLVSWMDPKQTVIMVYGNPETGTVTVFAVAGDRACIVSEGSGMLIGGVPKSRVPGKDGA